MDLVPGSIIAGRYRIDARVGAGGMGEVWAGEHLAIGMKVAIKTLLPAAAYDQEVVARFRREANLLGRIRSDHVARVVDFIQDPHAGLVLVMEYIEGLPLSKTLHQRKLAVEEAIDLGCDVIGALCDLHRAHIIHRDMKPGNIIMEPQPNGKYRGIVVDFGMGRIESGAGEDLEQTNLTRADMALGTLEYMAPEQILNSRDVTAASDLYAVGAMLYRAIAGRHIFGDAQDTELARAKLMTDAPPLETGRSDRIAQEFAAIVMRACKRRPQERYQKAEDMLNHLRSLQDAVRAQALEMSGFRHLLGGASIPPPAPQAAAQAPQQYAQQQYAQQHYQQQQQQQAHPSQQPQQQQQQQHASVSAVSASMSAAAPISVPVNQSRKMSGGAVAGLTALVVLALGAVGVFVFRERLGLVSASSAPAKSQVAAASAPPPLPSSVVPAVASATPTPSASAAVEAAVDDDGMEVETAAPAPSPSLWGRLPSTASPQGTGAPAGGSTGASTAAKAPGTSPTPTNKAPAPVPTNIKF